MKANRSASEPIPAGPAPGTVSRLRLAVVLGVCALALGVRGLAWQQAPRHSYLPDHYMVMIWSQEAFAHGPTALYFMPKPDQQRIAFHLQAYQPDGRQVERLQVLPLAYNYPPGSTAIFWLQGALWAALDPDVRSITPDPRVAAQNNFQPGPITSRLVNTHTSRFVAALPGVLFDFVLAWGVAALVTTLRRGFAFHGSPADPDVRPGWPEVLAFAVTLLAPPIWLDSAFWNQADSWIAAPLVWCLVALLRARWWLAGAIFGAALMIKPQAILMGPVLIFVAAWLLFGPAGHPRRLLEMGRFGLAAAIVVGLVLLPFAFAKPPEKWARFVETADPSASAWPRWLARSYGDLVFGDQYARTTMNAFNVWWFDYLGEVRKAESAGQRPGLPQLDAKVPKSMAGLTLTKQQWGKLWLVGGILATLGLCWRQRHVAGLSLAACAFLTFLCAFALPTSVHERYIYYCLPVGIALAFWRSWWWLPLAPLLLVATFELVAFRWVQIADLAVRGRSATLAGLVLAALVLALLLLVPRWSTARRAA